MTFRALLAACFFLVPSLVAQHTTEPSHAHALGIEVRPAKSRPFSAKDRIEITVTHTDGTIQTQQIDGPLLARDSHGRIYREIRGRVTDNSDPRSGLEYIVILDPVAHRRTECAITERTCVVFSYRERASVNPPPDGSLDNDYEFVPRQNLGVGLVEGLNVTGTRQTILDNADREGRPRVIEQEFWYSPDLEMNLIVAKKYSNGNSMVIHVLDISRAEPDPSLFQVPDGFSVQD